MLQSFKIWLNQLWVLGRTSTRHYVRFYPNPGFMFTLKAFGIRVKWSKHYGWSTKKV